MTQNSKHGLYLDLLHSLILDWRACRPTLSLELEGFYESIQKIVLSRGLGILFIDLPSFGKIFDQYLDTPTLHIGEQEFKGLPRALKILFRKVFPEQNDNLLPHDPNDVFFFRSLCYLFKKVDLDCAVEAKQTAIQQFLQDDLDIQIGFRDRKDDAVLTALSRIGYFLLREYPLCNPHELFPRHGPGAVAEGTKFRDKYLFSSWPKQLDDHFPCSSFAVYDLSQPSLDDSVIPSRVIAVPKTMKGPRIITAEPLALQYCQQSVNSFLRENMPNILRKRFLQLDNQDKSKDLARVASLQPDLLATVDLKSASDRLHVDLVSAVFQSRPDILGPLLACRNSQVIIDNQVYDICKYAGMGNATTFPVQSIVYLSICLLAIACSRKEGMLDAERGVLLIRNQKQYNSLLNYCTGALGVYGDDLIVPVSSLRYLRSLLSSLHLIVNEDKTFSGSGGFRESCGGDYYRGDDVTPLYLRSCEVTLGNLTSWVDVSNNSFRKGCWNVTSHMDNMLSRCRVKIKGVAQKTTRFLPVTQDDRFGIRMHTFMNGSPRGCKESFDSKLHARKYLCLKEVTIEKRVHRGSDSDLLQYFLESSPTEPFSVGWVRKSGQHLKAGWVLWS